MLGTTIIITLKGAWENKMVKGEPKIVVYKQVGVNKKFRPRFVDPNVGYFSWLYFD